MKNDSKNIIISFLVGIIVMLIIFIVLVVSGVISFSSNETDNNTVGSIKVDNSKDYVYDSDYTYDNQYTEFNRKWDSYDGNSKKNISLYGIPVEYTTGMQYLSNLVIPYINIDSADAVATNKEVENLYVDYAKLFDECAKDSEESENPSCTQILTYRTYQYDNVLSVVIIYASQATSKWVLNYKVYNFDLTDGSLMNYNDMLSKLRYDKESILVKMEQLLNEKMNSLWGDDLSSACSENRNCYEIALEKMNNSINDNSILFFVDNEGDLNLLLVPYYDAVQNGDINHYLIEVNK